MDIEELAFKNYYELITDINKHCKNDTDIVVSWKIGGK